MTNSVLPKPYRALDDSYAIAYLSDGYQLNILDDLLKNGLISVVSSSISPLLTIPAVVHVSGCASTKFDHFGLALKANTAIREASFYSKRLITEDESILKLQKQLDSLGLEVLSMKEYVEKINRQIEARDENATLYSSLTNTALPEWVGEDRLEF